MIFDSLEFTKESPFKDCLIHGLIRDSQGRKMSKSLGNGIDPIDVIDKYGVDALRYFLTTGSAPGQDIRYIEEKVESSAHYLNKIWNSARYVLESVGENFKAIDFKFEELEPVEKDIIIKLNKTIKSVESLMDKYEYSMASQYLYNFVYDDFCSAYLEMSKVSLQNASSSYQEVIKSVLVYILKNIIIMIYPYAPFIGKELYLALNDHKKSIMLETYPKALDIDETEIIQVSNLYKMIQDIRNYKVNNKLAPNYKLRFIVESDNLFKGFETYLARFSFAKEIQIVSKASSKGMRYAYQGANLYIEDDISEEELLAKKAKDIAYLEAEIKRSEGMLNNPNFVSKAPQEKVELERKKLEENKRKLAELK
jgi:valyl-tRNA synthetase